MDIEQIVIDNEKLVYFVYNKKIVKDAFVIKNREDILQEGRIGLFNAAKNYDTESGYAFSSYACQAIYNLMVRYIQQVRSKICEISLEEPISRTSNAETLQDIIPDVNDEIEDYIERQDLLDRIKEYYPKLSKREKQIVKFQIEGLTQKEIANKIGTTRSNVGTIVSKIRLKVSDCWRVNEKY